MPCSGVSVTIPESGLDSGAAGGLTLGSAGLISGSIGLISGSILGSAGGSGAGSVSGGSGSRSTSQSPAVAGGCGTGRMAGLPMKMAAAIKADIAMRPSRMLRGLSLFRFMLAFQVVRRFP